MKRQKLLTVVDFRFIGSCLRVWTNSTNRQKICDTFCFRIKNFQCSSCGIIIANIVKSPYNSMLINNRIAQNSTLISLLTDIARSINIMLFFVYAVINCLNT